MQKKDKFHLNTCFQCLHIFLQSNEQMRNELNTLLIVLGLNKIFMA